MFRFLLFVLFNFHLTTSEPCRDGESTFNGKCYRFISPSMDFGTAEGYCKTLGYDLVSIHSAFETSFLQSESKKQFDASTDMFFIGLNSSDGKTWTWVDGSDLGYTNWLPGQPASDNHCVAFLVSEGQWLTYPCSAAIDFVCSGIHGSTTVTTTPLPTSSMTQTTGTPTTSNPCAVPTTTTLMTTTNWWANNHGNEETHERLFANEAQESCPDGYRYYNETKKCYGYLNYYDTNDTIFKNCNGSIHTMGEDVFVADLMKSFLSQLWYCFTQPEDDFMYIVGFVSGFGHEDNYTWNDNTPFDYHPGANPSDYFEFGDQVISIINHVNQSIIWMPWENATYYQLCSACQYYLCKIDPIA